MSTMYERIDRLCKDNGTNVTAMCKELEIARSSLSELNSGRSKTLSAEKTAKIASYFGVSVDYLLGNEPKPSSETPKPDYQHLFESLTEKDQKEILLLMKFKAAQQSNPRQTVKFAAKGKGTQTEDISEEEKHKRDIAMIEDLY